MIYIKNLRDTQAGIRCDRTSILGNPFELRSELERDLVCDAFSKYMAEMVSQLNPNSSEIAFRIAQRYGLKIAQSWKRPHSGAIFMLELEGLRNLARKGDLTILCWCKPKRCHLETIKAWIS